MNSINNLSESIVPKIWLLESKQITSVIQWLVNQNHILLGSQIKSLSKTDYQLNKMFPWELTQKDVTKINQFINSFGDYIIKNNPMTEENFKTFLIWYIKKYSFDQRAIFTWIKLLKAEFEKSFEGKNTTVESLWNFIHNSKKILNDVFNEVFKPNVIRESLYSMVGLNYERIGLDQKLKSNEPYQIIMKWLIDEIMSIGPVIEYLANEPRECMKAIWDMLWPIEEFKRTLQDVISWYTKMFKSDSSTPEGQYEIGKWATQRIITVLLPGGSWLRNIVLKSLWKTTAKGFVQWTTYKVASKVTVWPWARANVDNM